VQQVLKVLQELTVQVSSVLKVQQALQVLQAL
jgi:hypothetical protein